MATFETAKARRRLVRRAGHRAPSLLSATAGMFTAIGFVTVVLAAFGAAGSRYGLRLDGLDTGRWRGAELGWAVVAAGAVFAAALFGGYTAGRMSWRSGARHGLLMFVLTAVVMTVVGGLAYVAEDVTISQAAWNDVGLATGVITALALLGAVLGGIAGERWHGRLMRDAERKTSTETTEDRPRYTLGHDATTVDLAREEQPPSVEAEREAVRQARADVGM